MSNSTWARRLRRIVFTGVTALSVSLAPFIVAAPSAQAAPVAGFSPGNIIDDALFYNGNAMSTAEVQSFLNQKLPSCRIGTSPYIPGWPSPSGSGNIIASNCLKGFQQSTTSRAADSYCSGYAGLPNESAAAIIAKVGRSCGISQKVLLVMLEKEQSLVTDSWPVTRQYNYALGMNCPDSGPGNSANCDAASAGFAMQLYLGARQLKVYKGNPYSFNYRPFEFNNIQWHPSAGCGTSSVYIENWATAALYIYTPYRPNQAALNAGWGTGDSCSSYGNRNFYLFYTGWFGSTQGIPVTGLIAQAWQVLGGASGSFGSPTGVAVYSSASGGGYYQQFTGGYIFSENRTGNYSWMSYGPFLQNYQAAGFVTGPWGWPTAKAECRLVNGGCTMAFHNGTVAYSVVTGSILVPTGLDQAWLGQGGVNSALGYPTEAAVVGLSGVKSQQFAGGYYTWSQAGGGQPVPAGIQSLWLEAGGASSIGVPIDAGRSLLGNGGGTLHELSHGAIWSSPSGVVQMSNGPFRAQYTAAGGPEGPWGWPKSNAACRLIDGGCYMEFQNGTGMWSSGTGLVLVSNEAFEIWNREAGSFGYPVSVPVPVAENGGGTVQTFTRGAVWSSPLGTVQMSNGPFKAGYLFRGGHRGGWGWPIENAICSGDFCTMNFQFGAVEYNAGVFEFTPTS